jgi:hypothetical protein
MEDSEKSHRTEYKLVTLGMGKAAGPMLREKIRV